ncbi:MAG: YqgE/AlgH family protein [Rhodosalinus sp.]|uniref:YqgE/AlgH family protein n=1 Tax=Rhodosalinus sp. TaxID=2047741 RepID=UPI00397C581B
MSETTPLTGKLLIAMPAMGDPRFARSVVFLCAHSEEGAMGLILNKPTDDITLADLFEQLSIEAGPQARRMKVHFGGPVETGRGFVLHGPDYASDRSTLHVDANFGMTATLDILEELARGKGPQKALMALGYAGWGPGQLEAELAENAWLTTEATPELVFAADDGGKWQAALGTLGIDALMLSGSGGRA